MTNPYAIQLRGTIFMPAVIGYSQANVEKYRVVLEESVVAPVPPTAIIPLAPINIQLPQESFFQENGPWQLIKGALRVVFFPNKVDIIQESVNIKGSSEPEFCKLCSKIFSNIIEIASVDANRLAYAPIYAKDQDGAFNAQEFWASMLNTTSFEGSQIEETNITSNYKVNKIINKKKVIINFRSVFSDAIRNIAPGVSIKGSVMMSFDINTAVIPNHQDHFSQSDIFDFFSSVQDWSNEFYSAMIR